MTDKQGSLLDALKSRGEEFFNRVSNELMANPNFTRAMQAAWKGKEKLDRAVAQALKGMNIPSRSEFNRALQRIGELEEEIGRLKRSRGAPRGTAASGAARKATGRGGRGSGSAAGGSTA